MSKEYTSLIKAMLPHIKMIVEEQGQPAIKIFALHGTADGPNLGIRIFKRFIDPHGRLHAAIIDIDDVIEHNIDDIYQNILQNLNRADTYSIIDWYDPQLLDKITHYIEAMAKIPDALYQC